MDVLQKEIDEVYATQLIADEILDNGVVEQHQRPSNKHNKKGIKRERAKTTAAPSAVK